MQVSSHVSPRPSHDRRPPRQPAKRERSQSRFGISWCFVAPREPLTGFPQPPWNRTSTPSPPGATSKRSWMLLGSAQTGWTKLGVRWERCLHLWAQNPGRRPVGIIGAQLYTGVRAIAVSDSNAPPHPKAQKPSWILNWNKSHDSRFLLPRFQERKKNKKLLFSGLCSR